MTNYDELLDAQLDAIIDIRAEIANLQLTVSSRVDKFLYQNKPVMTEKESRVYSEALTELSKDVTKLQLQLIELAKTEAKMVLECQELKATYRENI